MSHQARMGMTPYVDQCVTCFAAISAAAVQHNLDHGREFVSDGRARRMLLDASVPTVELWRVERTYRKKLFGRHEYLSTTIPVGRGWLLGEFRWEYRSGSDSTGIDVKEDFETVLVAYVDPSQATEAGLELYGRNIDLTKVVRRDGMYVSLSEKYRGAGSFLGSWEAISKTVKELAEPA